MTLVDLAAEYGVRNLRFFIPMSVVNHVGFLPGIGFRSSWDEKQQVECVICETRYPVAEGYKITLRAVDVAFGKTTYYQSDLESLITNHPETHEVYVETIDGYTPLHLN